MVDCDWWMDIDLESAKKNYTDFADCFTEDTETAKEMTGEEMESHRFHLGQEDEPDCTFMEQVNRLDQVPQLFASTEY